MANACAGFSALVLASADLAAIIPGAMDVSNRAAGFHPRVIGFVFLVSGGVMLSGAIVVVLALVGAIIMTPRLGQLVLAAAALGMGLALYPTFAFNAARRGSTYVVPAVAVAIIFLAMLLEV